MSSLCIRISTLGTPLLLNVVGSTTTSDAHRMRLVVTLSKTRCTFRLHLNKTENDLFYPYISTIVQKQDQSLITRRILDTHHFLVSPATKPGQAHAY